MEKHRASVETSPTTSRRWVWELIQNAKDVNIEGRVQVLIDADLKDPNAHVTFSTENAQLRGNHPPPARSECQRLGRPERVV